MKDGEMKCAGVTFKESEIETLVIKRDGKEITVKKVSEQKPVTGFSERSKP